MNARPRKTTRITVGLSDRDYTELTALASRADVSLAWLARHAIGEFLRRRRQGEELQLPLPLEARLKE